MFVADMLYAFLTAIGVFGIGHFLWTILRQESNSISGQDSDNNFSENSFLAFGISWFLGYFCYEGILSTLSVIHLFNPLGVTITGSTLTLLGYYWIFFRKNFSKEFAKKISTPRWEFIVLGAMAGFLFFWNLYPTFDCDALSFYFPMIQQFLDHGGKFFSRFADVRFLVPPGENLLYALGFAWHPHSTVFPQIIQGLSKVMLLFCVYGAARSLGAGVFSLAAAAFVVSEEHIVASGANVSVHINIILAFSIFLSLFGFFVFLTARKKEYFFLAAISVFNAMACKYLGVAYLGCFLIITALSFFANKELYAARKLSFKKQPATILSLAAAVFFASISYIYSWITTGTPLFPASLGPLRSPFYDNAVMTIGTQYHYHLNLSDALKNVTAFMVWPGILPSKILLPLALGTSLLAMLFLGKKHRFFFYGLSFFIMSIIVIILQAMYMVFEMRYYRFGIGVYSLACAFFLAFIFHLFLERSKILKKWEKPLSISLILLICIYCIRYSFDVMGSSRPYAEDVVKFLTFQKSESQIIAERYPKVPESYAAYKKANLDPKQLALFLPFNWPYTFYPVKGQHIGFSGSAAFPSVTYFNEGLFARALLDKNFRYIFNRYATERDYPLAGGAVYNVLNQCAHPISEEQKDILMLSETCLEKIAAKKDLQDAQGRLDRALSKIKSHPPYAPFNPPPYGGSSEVIK
ncbi:MAG TPA: hypothetical protein PL155_05450 [Candidatus Omnitrophota bacterium]|nr:hypothetical protein [Candidatus Omnitrophota bacterium]HPD84073.1 hypothetical protein [Candidatus Omnitrophota bacterium]HRZ02930.1 hypothetical protein [Candidatus Omnitrophota bacterium]